MSRTALACVDRPPRIPVAQMRVVLDALHHEADAFERDYLQFVDELVFGEQVTFTEARAVFIELAESLIGQLKA